MQEKETKTFDLETLSVHTTFFYLLMIETKKTTTKLL